VGTKSELLAQLENAKNNYILGHAALSLFAEPQVYPLLERQSASFGTYTITFDQVARLLRVPSDRDIALKEFLTMLLRALIKETFELLRDYSAATGQTPILKSQGWYQFARLIRNCISHNFMFEFSTYDKTLLPVTWGGRTIEPAMDRQFLPLSFFGYIEAWELFATFKSFASTILS
jgi:hypothetical protein